MTLLPRDEKLPGGSLALNVPFLASERAFAPLDPDDDDVSLECLVLEAAAPTPRFSFSGRREEASTVEARSEADLFERGTIVDTRLLVVVG